MSTLTQIVAFIDVVEEQGFSAAAKKQGVSTAAISRQIALLEADLKTALLRRSTRRMDLTEIGAAYYQQVKQTMAQLHDAELAIISGQNEATGVLRISSGYYSVQALLPRLSAFMQENPHLHIKLELGEGHLSDLTQGSIDIIFGSSLQAPPDYVQRRVGSTRFVLCASPEYLKQHGTPTTPADLKKHRYITHSGRKPDNEITFNDHPPVFVDPILWLNDSRAMCDCAVKGIGIVKLHHYIAQEALKSGALIEILSEFNEAEKPMYLYYLSTRHLLPKIRRFIDFYSETPKNNAGA